MSRTPGTALVLVVDDEPTLRDLYTTLLGKAGHSVVTARDGREALAMIASHQPDAMVLDLSMPNLDGMGVLEGMRGMTGQKPRTVVVTARHAAADIERAISLGASDYLAKPFEPSQLVARVARLTRRRAG